MRIPGTAMEAKKVYFNPSFQELDALIARSVECQENRV